MHADFIEVLLSDDASNKSLKSKSGGSSLTWRFENLHSQAVWIDWPADQGKVDLTGNKASYRKENDRHNGQEIFVARHIPGLSIPVYWSFIQIIAS